MAQQSARRGRKNQVYSSCLEHAFMIWFRSENSHTGPQLHRCIRGRTDGSTRLRADLPAVQARGKQFSDQPKYFIAEVTNPASLTLQFCDSEAALQSGTSHPTGGMLKMLNTILLVIMLTVLGIAISPPGSAHRIFLWRIIIGACVVGTVVVASAG